MNIEEIKKRLKEYKPEDIVLTHHTEIRLLQRNIERRIVEENILNPEKLIDVIDENQNQQSGIKYKLIFELSKNRNLVLIVAFDKNIIIITALIRYRKWVRAINLKERK